MDFLPIVQFTSDEFYLPIINAKIPLIDQWLVCEDNTAFQNFRQDFPISTFPDVNEREEEKIKKNLFPPLFTLTNDSLSKSSIPAYIFGYLFYRYALTGSTLLHIRSITKLEQSWASYVIMRSHGYGRDNIKALSMSGYPACLTNPEEFKYKWKHYDGEVVSRLRILMVDIKDFVLALYIVDDYNNFISDQDFHSFLDRIIIEN